ncbi:hypothetical protein KY312_00815 [Candidatus Woesearchaeota archaeon]|nr:hypothetical protein [Candidatus Woesearchaeota archaeon]
MWLSATEGIEKTDAVRMAIPHLEEILQKKVDVDEVMELVLPGLDKLQEPLPPYNEWRKTDWQKRKLELSLYVPKLYFEAVDRIGEEELERRRQEKKERIEKFMKQNRTFELYAEMLKNFRD